MNQQNTINPDTVCQQALNAKMDVYRSKESFEAVLKMYNDQVENLVNVINLMKNRILTLESELERAKTEVSVLEKSTGMKEKKEENKSKTV